MNRTLAAASSSAVCLSVSSHHTVSIAVNGFGSSPSLSPPPPPSRGDAAPALAAVLAAADSAAFAAASIALCRFGSVAYRAIDNSKQEEQHAMNATRSRNIIDSATCRSPVTHLEERMRRT